MLKKQCRNVSGRAGLLLLSVMGCALSLFMACATSQQPKEDYQMALIEKQVNEMDKKIDEIYHRVSVIQFMVDNHERVISDLEKRLYSGQTGDSPAVQDMASLSPVETDTLDQVSEAPIPSSSLPAEAAAVDAEPKPQPPPDIHESPQMHYNKALARYKNADYQAAASLFNGFVEKYPDHELADNALYWEAECRYAMKTFPQAITAFKRVVDEYPNGGKVPDAMLKTGYAYLSIDDRASAKVYLKKVIKNYPFSPAGTKAEMMLKKLK